MSTNKGYVKIFVLCAVALSFALSGCGNGSSGSSPQTVSGVASAAAPISGTVTLQDSSTPAVTQMTLADADGNYSFNVNGLTAPFMLTVDSPASATTTTTQMYSFSKREGRANINPFSNVTVQAAAGVSDNEEMSSAPTRSMMDTIGHNQERILEGLKEKLAPLFELYGITLDPVADDLKSQRTAFNALFHDVKITVYKGTILVTNRQTGGIIFEALVTDIAGGTFYPENLPGGSGNVDGSALYATYCSSCHGPLATSSKLGATATQIQSAINSVSAMKTLSTLTSEQIQAIAAALAAAPPSSCTYTYSAWGVCQPDNTQTRTVLSSSPSGCTGTPVLSQACTYTPQATVTKSDVTTSCTGCHGLTSNTTVFKSGGYTVTGRSAANWLTTINNMVAMGARLATGKTAQDYANYLATCP